MQRLLPQRHIFQLFKRRQRPMYVIHNLLKVCLPAFHVGSNSRFLLKVHPTSNTRSKPEKARICWTHWTTFPSKTCLCLAFVTSSWPANRAAWTSSPSLNTSTSRMKTSKMFWRIWEICGGKIVRGWRVSLSFSRRWKIVWLRSRGQRLLSSTK